MSVSLSIVRPDRTSASRWSAEARQDSVPRTLSDDLKAIHSHSVRVHYLRNETIFSEGDSADYVYKIISGVVRLCKFTPDGRRQIPDFMFAGDFFGLTGAVEHGFAAEAAADTIVLAFPREQIERLGASNAGMRHRTFELLTEQLLSMQRHLLVIGCNNAKERVACFLMRLAKRANARSGELVDMPMSRQDVADHLGLTIETVCRAIAELKRDGMILCPNIHQIVLRDTGGLMALTNGDRFVRMAE